MESTSTAMVFKWFETIWTQSDDDTDMDLPKASYAITGGGGSVPLDAAEFRRAHRSIKEGLADIRLGFESFVSDGRHVSCVMSVKARNKFSGDPIAFRSTFDGRIRDGRLISASNAIDYLLTG